MYIVLINSGSIIIETFYQFNLSTTYDGVTVMTEEF